MTKKHIIKSSLLLVVGLAIASLIAVYQIKSENRARSSFVVSKNFGGDFILVNQENESVTAQDFKGKYRLIYFGFTYCPAICPTELQRINLILEGLGDKADQIQPIFITVDPERDTPAVIKQYVAQFHPRLIGLTGTLEQIDVAKKAYKIYAAKVQDDTMSDYTMDHSSFIYFMGPDESLIRIFKMDDQVEDIITVINHRL